MVGNTLVYRLTGIVHFALGDLVGLGVFIALFVTSGRGPLTAASASSWRFAAGLVVALLATAAFGSGSYDLCLPDSDPAAGGCAGRREAEQRPHPRGRPCRDARWGGAARPLGRPVRDVHAGRIPLAAVVLPGAARSVVGDLGVVVFLLVEIVVDGYRTAGLDEAYEEFKDQVEQAGYTVRLHIRPR